MTSIVEQIVATEEMVAQIRGRRPKRLPKPRLQKIPDGAARNYRSALLATLDEAKRLVDGLLVPRLEEIARVAQTRDDVRDRIAGDGRGVMGAFSAPSIRYDVDGWQKRIAAIMSSVRVGLAPDDEQTTATTVGREVSSFNVSQVRSQMRGVLGVDVFFNEPRLEAALDDFTTQNVALIKSVPAQYFDQVERVVRSGFRSGRRASDISAELTERFNVARSRADLIARDQINKLNANLTRDRQQALGITEYVWRTSRDERVRPSHRALEGSRQQWDDPPSVGHPGEDFRCRCTAEPIIPGAPEPEVTTPADVKRRAPRRRVTRARPAPRRAAAPTERDRVVTLPRSGKTVALSDAQGERRATSARLQNNETARARATSAVRGAHLLWQWVHGSKRKTSVMLKQGAIREFGLRGVAYNPRGFKIPTPDVDRTARDLRRIYNRTQRELARQGKKTIRVYRGLVGDVAERGAVESWTTDPAIARKFGGRVVVEDIPIERILTLRGGPDWLDGVFGNQGEVLVLF